jgi:hypothetical protein
MDWDPLNWFGDITGAATDWLSGAAGSLASGLEGAMVAVIGDLWEVIEGPLLVLLGIGIFIVVIAWVFKNQIIQLGGIAATAAA